MTERRIDRRRRSRHLWGMWILFAPAVMLIGLIIFLAVRNNADVKELGKLTFFAGILVTTLMLARHVGTLLP